MLKWLNGLLSQIAGPTQDVLADTLMFALAALCHRALDWVIGPMVPKGWESALLLLQETVFVAFCIIYVVLLYDIVAVFIPYLARMPRNHAVDKHGQYRLPFDEKKVALTDETETEKNTGGG